MKRIIIADDSSTARMFTRKCLEMAGIGDAEFVEAENGEQALAALEGRESDLVLTDLFMAGMDGSELLKMIRSRPEWKRLPVIVITSAKSPAREAQLIALGANGVYGKPISPATMAKVIKVLARDSEA